MSELDPGLLAQRIVYAGLEAVRAAAPLDLAAYLHEAPGHGPQLYLGAPTLADIDPTAAFNLFAALRDGLDGERDGDDLTVPGYSAIAVTTRGDHSRGVHVLGRRDGALEGDERSRVAALSRTFGELAHSIEPAAGPAAHPAGASILRVLVETAGSGAEATVTIELAGEERTQTVRASSATRAVAMAAVANVDPAMKVVDAGEEKIGDERVVLALVRDAADRRAAGAALVDEQTDLLRAAATAALDAATRVR